MTPVAQVLARLLARLRRATVQPDPTVPPTDRPGDTHSRKVRVSVARAHDGPFWEPVWTEESGWALHWAGVTAAHDMPELAAEWLIAASSRDGIPRILPPTEE